MTFFSVIEIVGTLAFAISGIRLAAAKRFDWFGAYVVGITTAIGGGTMRDIMLDLTPFWMLNGDYLVVTAFALAIVIGLRKYLVRLDNTFYIFDAVAWACLLSWGSRRPSPWDSRCGWPSLWVRSRALPEVSCVISSSTRNR